MRGLWQILHKGSGEPSWFGGSVIIIINLYVNSSKIKIDISPHLLLDMIRAVCKNYGFDCNFTCEGGMEEVVEKFGKHTMEKHGIEYSEETLTKFMLNNNS